MIIDVKRLIQFLKAPDFLPLVIVLLLGIIAGSTLLYPGYFNMHDDLQMMRQLEMEKCFKDWQIPCRWVPDMGYGYGFPLFNYYPPLPYLVGQVIRLTTVSFVTTIKLTFLLSILISGVSMYLLAREFWGRLGGLVSSAFYIWAPYHATDVFVRGAMNESWALTWFPLILWVSYRFIQEKGSFKWIIILSLSWFALLTSHNLMAIIFGPIFAVWCLLLLWRENAWGKIPRLILSGIWAFGLAAFFSIPVLLEQKLVQIETLTVGYYEYIAHFADLNQLFISRFWGYGASVWGPEDNMAFQIGQLHWVLSLIVGIAATLMVIAILLRLSLIKKLIFADNLLIVAYYFLLTGWFSAFMAHLRSTPIWLFFEKLEIVQFPWRFLTLVIVSFSFLAGFGVYIVESWNKWAGRVLTMGLILAVMWFNKDYFRPEWMGPLTDKEKFSNAAWELLQTAGIYDYLPKDAKIAPQGPREEAADIVDGQAVISEVKEGTNWFKANIKAETDNTKIRVSIFNFAGWKAFIDGKSVKIELDKKDELGRMHVVVPKGEHRLELKLFNTPPRTIGNTISLISWSALLVSLLYIRKTKVYE